LRHAQKFLDIISHVVSLLPSDTFKIYEDVIFGSTN
jgi:hypothetical protein